jgi:hypothetical protein
MEVINLLIVGHLVLFNFSKQTYQSYPWASALENIAFVPWIVTKFGGTLVTGFAHWVGKISSWNQLKP